jgi:hypothetical protein
MQHSEHLPLILLLREKKQRRVNLLAKLAESRLPEAQANLLQKTATLSQSRLTAKQR